MKSLFFAVIFLTVSGAAGKFVVFGQQPQTLAAPEFEKNLEWLNTAKPLSIAGLRGKVILLDFWTYGCINCIHVIPDLKKLEAKYADNLVVIGVHSGRFLNERNTENIRRIIFRYELEHPIVNDADFKIWKAYGVNAYPTQVLIDPSGNVILMTTGEKQLSLQDETIGNTVEKFRLAGKLDEKPLKLALEKDKFAASPLLFPGKILADESSDRLFIADSNHNRIVVTKLDGSLLEVIGSGNASRADGSFASAGFNRPQGLALDGNFLYVADTSNHLIRRVDLENKKVETVAGTGAQARQETGGAARETMLNSPWDLIIVGKQLFVAMAGNHQIWRLDLEKNTIAPFAGSGYEGRKDGGLENATFAQPSALAFDGKNLYVADPESNLIRIIDLTEKTVRTLAGGQSADFEDAGSDGKIRRLQHPLGLAVSGKDLFIADTYNHKIRALGLSKRLIKDFTGDGKAGSEDGRQARFYEPGGLSGAGGKLYVADTNNHSIRVIDLKTGQVSTLKINGLQPPQTAQTKNLQSEF
jgi:DNA-binding beta-propeller fold protein YncE